MLEDFFSCEAPVSGRSSGASSRRGTALPARGPVSSTSTGRSLASASRPPAHPRALAPASDLFCRASAERSGGDFFTCALTFLQVEELRVLQTDQVVDGPVSGEGLELDDRLALRDAVQDFLQQARTLEAVEAVPAQLEALLQLLGGLQPAEVSLDGVFEGVSDGLDALLQVCELLEDLGEPALRR